MSEQTIVLKIQINGSDVSVTGSPEKVEDSPVAVEAKPVQVKKPKTVKKTEQKSEHIPFNIPTSASLTYKSETNSRIEELINKPHVPFYINVNTPKSPEEIEGERMIDANRGRSYEPPANESDKTFIYAMIITAVVVGFIVLSEYPPVKDFFSCLAHKDQLPFIVLIMGFVVPFFLFYIGDKKYRDSVIPFVIFMIDIYILSCILANK